MMWALHMCMLKALRMMWAHLQGDNDGQHLHVLAAGNLHSHLACGLEPAICHIDAIHGKTRQHPRVVPRVVENSKYHKQERPDHMCPVEELHTTYASQLRGKYKSCCMVRRDAAS
jgi:hypothetical protein